MVIIVITLAFNALYTRAKSFSVLVYTLHKTFDFTVHFVVRAANKVLELLDLLPEHVTLLVFTIAPYFSLLQRHLGWSSIVRDLRFS